MARKENLFKKTEGDLDDGIIKATGVGLRQGEILALDDLGAQLGTYLDAEPVARNTLMRIAIRWFLTRYIKGDLTLEDLAREFDVPEKPKPRLKY